MSRFLAFLAAGALCLLARGAASQSALSAPYPAKATRVLSTFSSGSPADGMMRMIGQKMAESMGQPVVVEAQPGAGGVVAAQAVVRAAPDGYTLLHSAPTTLVATPFLVDPPPYDPLRDFTFVTALADAMTCMMVSAGAPFRSVQELVDYARANPGRLAYASNGVGASYHLEMELLNQKFGTDIVHVPYKGGQGGLNALVAGQIPIAFSSAASGVPQMRAGKIRILAVMSAKRWDGLPEIPAMGELFPDYEKIPSGNKMVGPAGIPAAVLKRLHAEVLKALAVPEVVERVRKIGFFTVGSTPEEFAAEVRKDLQVMARGIKAAKLRGQ